MNRGDRRLRLGRVSVGLVVMAGLALGACGSEDPSPEELVSPTIATTSAPPAETQSESEPTSPARADDQGATPETTVAGDSSEEASVEVTTTTTTSPSPTTVPPTTVAAAAETSDTTSPSPTTTVDQTPATAPPSTTITTVPPTTTTEAHNRAVAPDFTLELGSGETFTLSAEPRPVYLLFWAEW